MITAEKARTMQATNSKENKKKQVDVILHDIEEDIIAQSYKEDNYITYIIYESCPYKDDVLSELGKLGYTVNLVEDSTENYKISW